MSATEPEKITLHVVGPISTGVLTEERAEELRQMVANQLCDIYWGSHGCSLKRDHEGWHICQSEDEDEPHSTVSPTGLGENGFQWDLYGDDAP